VSAMHLAFTLEIARVYDSWKGATFIQSQIVYHRKQLARTNHPAPTPGHKQLRAKQALRAGLSNGAQGIPYMRQILRTGQRQKPQNAIQVVISINTMETSSVSRPLSIGQRNARVEALLKLPAWPRGMAMATLSVDATSTSLLPLADGAPNTGRQYKRVEPWAYWTGAKVTLLASALLRAPDSNITVRFRCKMLSIIICVPKPHQQATRLSRCWP
jgi:hypothetical protein